MFDAHQVGARPAMTEEYTIGSPGLVWMAVHGTLCLGLRHPQFNGPSRPFVVNFVRALGDCLVEWGALTPDELAMVQRVENEESPHRDTF